MKDFSSMLQRTGIHMDLDQIQIKVKETLSCYAFKTVFSKTVWCHIRVQHFISLQQKRSCILQQRWYESLKCVSQLEWPNYKRLIYWDHLLNIFIFKLVILMYEKQLSITFWIRMFRVININMLEYPSQSTKVHKDKILTILRTIGSLRT